MSESTLLTQLAEAILVAVRPKPGGHCDSWEDRVDRVKGILRHNAEVILEPDRLVLTMTRPSVSPQEVSTVGE